MPFSRRPQRTTPPLELEERDLPPIPQDSVTAWRWRSLIDAFRVSHEGPCDPDDLGQLALVAHSNADLHDACRALEQGCGIQRLVDIFT